MKVVLTGANCMPGHDLRRASMDAGIADFFSAFFDMAGLDAAAWRIGYAGPDFAIHAAWQCHAEA